MTSETSETSELGRTTGPTAVEWRPRGHPVRWALAVVLVVAGASMTSIWFGWASPRVTVETTKRDRDGDEVAITLDIHNQAHAGMTVLGVGESLPGLRLEDVSLESGTGIAASDTVTATLRYRITDCATAPDDLEKIPLRLRTSAGLRRTVDWVVDPTDRWTSSLLADAC